MAADAGESVVERYELAACRHCGRVIARRPGREHWAHLTLWREGPDRDPTWRAYFLNRCQTDVPRYGYDAMPDSGVPCGCAMCTLHGEAVAQ